MANLNYLTNTLSFNWHTARLEHNQDRIHYSNQFDKNKASGGLGEMAVVAWIEALTGNNHIVFNNVLVPDKHSISGDAELDIIWLSPGLITVIEVKAYQGDLEVYDHARWIQRVEGKKWEVKNPLDQCFRQCRLLRDYFKQHKVHVPIRGIVAFPRVDKLIIKDTPRLPLISFAFTKYKP